MEETLIKKEKMTSQRDAGGKQIIKSAHKVGDAVDEKRKRYSEKLEKMRSLLSLKMETICTKVDLYMCNMYEKRDQKFNEQLKELFSCLDTIATMETELEQFKRELDTLYLEMN